MNIPVTSKLQQWGKGNPNKKKPEIIGKNDYGKKRHENIIAWDPRPTKFRNTYPISLLKILKFC